MQRLIDADKVHNEIENMPIKNSDKWFNFLQKACMRIAKAPTVLTIPDNPTNGDLIMSLYKNLFIHEVLAFGNITAIQVSIDKKHMQTFDFDWWNSPYKADVEPQETEG